VSSAVADAAAIASDNASQAHAAATGDLARRNRAAA
jgi:hypothetical protein